MKELSNIIFGLSVFTGALLILEPMIYGLAHPDLTHTQVFLDRWINYLIVFILISVNVLIDNFLNEQA